MAKDAATTSTEAPKRGFNASRQFNGTSFLTLEHVGYFVLVTALPLFLAIGILTAMNLWNSGAATGIQPLIYPKVPLITYTDTTTTAVQAAATLVVLTAFLYALRRRTVAEYDKRPGYKSRVGYKLPVYTSLAALTAATIASFVAMLTVFLDSLTQIGVAGSDIGKMYTDSFVPALIALVVFGFAAWYVFCFAKGKDTSKLFIGALSLFTVATAIALFVTVMTISHDPNRGNGGPVQIQPYQNNNGLFNY